MKAEERSVERADWAGEGGGGEVEEGFPARQRAPGTQTANRDKR